MKSNYNQLGQYIEMVSRTNSDLKYGIEDVRGCSNTKQMMQTRANLIGRTYEKFIVLRPQEFVFNRRTTRNGEKIGMAYNNTDREYIFTNDYVAFRVKQEYLDKLLPDYLYMFFCRDEFDRYARYKSTGSATEFFNWEDMCAVPFEIPPMDFQQLVVNAYKVLNERIETKQKINDNLSAQMRAYFKEYTANNASITGKLKDYSVMQYGYTETATTEPVGPKFLRITDIAQNYIDWNGVPYCPISEENHKKYVLSEGDVVVARTGATVGYAKMVGRNIPDSVFASFLVRIRPIDVEYRYYFGLAITSAEFLDFVQTNAGGSAQPQANPPLLGEFELSIPNKQSLSEFNKKISSFLGVIETNETEISKLHEVKDTMVKMLSSR